MLGDILSRGGRTRLVKPVIKTELRCEKCGFKVVRDYKEGDYISKVDDQKCSKCGNNLMVDLIYSIPPPTKT